MIDVSRIQALLHKVPRPPEDKLPRGAGDEDCDEFEKRTGIVLPPDLRDWLKTSNGPCVGPGGVFGIRPARMHLDIESHLEMHPSWKESKWIPIAGDGCGNNYVVATKHEFGDSFPVLFVDSYSPEAPAYVVASDIGHFLVFLLERELGKRGWPFDAESVTQDDPDILRSRGVALPWNRAAARV